MGAIHARRAQLYTCRTQGGGGVTALPTSPPPLPPLTHRQSKNSCSVQRAPAGPTRHALRDRQRREGAGEPSSMGVRTRAAPCEPVAQKEPLQMMLPFKLCPTTAQQPAAGGPHLANTRRVSGRLLPRRTGCFPRAPLPLTLTSTPISPPASAQGGGEATGEAAAAAAGALGPAADDGRDHPIRRRHSGGVAPPPRPPAGGSPPPSWGRWQLGQRATAAASPRNRISAGEVMLVWLPNSAQRRMPAAMSDSITWLASAL